MLGQKRKRFTDQFLGVIQYVNTTQIKPLVIGSKLTMHLLGIGRSTFDKWVAIGRLNDLKLHRTKKTFAYAEIEALAKLPPKK